MKGETTTAHSAISGTVTSSAIYVGAYNAVHLHCVVAGTGSWEITLQGCNTATGTFVDEYYAGVQSGDTISANKGFTLNCPPEYCKIVATEASGTSTLTVNVTPVMV